MSNTVQAYETRPAGFSHDDLRDHIIQHYQHQWHGKALDLGCGSGSWIRCLQGSKRFQQIDGMDHLDSRDSDLKNINFYLTDLAKQKFNVPDQSYDFVFAIEVLEHLENPRHCVREIGRILKPGGIFIMSTPSVDSLTSRLSYLVRGYFPAFCDHDYHETGHITPISQFDFHRMCREAGLNKCHDDFTMTGRLPMMKLTWQTLLKGLKGKYFSDNYISVVTK